jgi:hypothetical protein
LSTLFESIFNSISKCPVCKLTGRLKAGKIEGEKVRRLEREEGGSWEAGRPGSYEAMRL